MKRLLQVIVITYMVLWGLIVFGASIQLVAEKMGAIMAVLSIFLIGVTIPSAAIYIGFVEHNWPYFFTVFLGWLPAMLLVWRPKDS